MRTSVWKSPRRLKTFSAAILASAVPQLPEPITATRCFPLGKGEGGRDGTGEEGRVTAAAGQQGERTRIEPQVGLLRIATLVEPRVGLQ